MSIELNARNAKSVARRVMKVNDLKVREGFPQVKSSYTLSTLADRYRIDLAEDRYTAIHEVADGNSWKQVAVSNFEGARQLVEDKCMGFIELLTKNNYV